MYFPGDIMRNRISRAVCPFSNSLLTMIEWEKIIWNNMKRKKSGDPPVPPERRETLRRRIVSALDAVPMSARDISVEVGLSEKEVYGHLEHIRRTFNRKSDDFRVTPAACRQCGFVFRKRDKLRKPGKCPVCHSENIGEPMFSVKRD